MLSTWRKMEKIGMTGAGIQFKTLNVKMDPGDKEAAEDNDGFRIGR